MAILNGGPFGIISGKVGNLIGYNDRGAQAFRKIPAKGTKLPTAAQREQRMRSALAIHFLAPLKSITGKGYGNGQGKRSRSAQCMAYHTKHAIKGTFPDLEIDYGKVVLATGHLAGADNGEVFSNGAACLNFSWTERVRWGTQGATDQAVLVVYNPSKHRHEFLRTASDRASQCAALNVPIAFSGDRVHCWIVFISANGKEFSASSYLGTVTVA